jgi:hypothetical protein
VSKKLIAKRLGRTCVKGLNKLIRRKVDPLPVKWCRRRNTWVIREADIAAWDERQLVPADEAEKMGFVPKRHRAA